MPFSFCYICTRPADAPTKNNEAPLCRRCVLDELTNSDPQPVAPVAIIDDEKTDPGIGPVPANDNSTGDFATLCSMCRVPYGTRRVADRWVRGGYLDLCRSCWPDRTYKRR